MGEPTGELIYEGNGARVRFYLRIALVISGLPVLVAIVLTARSDVYQNFGAALLILVLLSVFATVALMTAMLWGRIVQVFSLGIRFETRYAGPDHRKAPRFVSFRDITWVFGDGKRPLLGIKLGMKEGWVRHISQFDVDIESFLRVVKGFVKVLEEDPEAPRLLASLEERAGGLERLWWRHDQVKWGPVVVVFATSIGAVAIALVSVGSSDRSVVLYGFVSTYLLLAALVLVAGATAIGWVRLDGDRYAALLWLERADEDQVLASFDRALRRATGATMVADRAWPLVARHRVYRLEQPCVSLIIAYTGRGEGSPAGWYVRYTAAKADAGALGQVERSLARWAVEAGLIPGHSSRIHHALGHRVRESDKMMSP